MLSYLPVISIAIRASVRCRACLTACVIQATTLPITSYSGVRRKSQDEIGRMFSSHNNESRRICRRHSRENAGINNEDVVRAIDLGIEVNDRCSANNSAVGPELAGAEPVIGTPSADVCIGKRDLEIKLVASSRGGWLGLRWQGNRHRWSLVEEEAMSSRRQV